MRRASLVSVKCRGVIPGLPSCSAEVPIEEPGLGFERFLGFGEVEQQGE